MFSGFRQFTRVIANPAIGTSLLVMAGAVSGAALGVVPAKTSSAQSVQAQQPLTIEGPTAVEFPENSTANVATYRVVNAASDSTISWSIDGTDARRLSIDSGGVLRFKAAKNFEKPNDGNKDNSYEIELSATGGATPLSVEVIVTITDVNEPPAFELNSAEFSVEENASANRRVGRAFTVTDPDDGDSRTFSVEGDDADLFHIDAEGQIRVRRGAVLDYETSGVFKITAVVTDQGGLTDSLPVQISLTDADDPGVVAFSPAKPFIGVPFTAAVSDQDGVTGRIRWRWHRAMSADDEFERIDGGTRSSYTPVEDDEGYILRVTVSYTDNFEDRASASGISAAVGRNTAPQYESASISLTVPEEAPAGTDVGDPVSATDSDDDDLGYTLSGEDASYFVVNDSTGQVTVGAEALPDSETKGSYTVIVTATDEAGATASITVTISATVPNAPPVITGSAAVNYAENGTASLATYSATDPEEDEITWSVGGTDAARVSINDSGVLSFKSSPDYEKPNDGNKNNVYEVTVTASDGNLSSTKDVEITVTNVNEAPSITGSAAVSYAENGTASVATYSATDPEEDEIAWSVGGTDAARFSISTTGALSFRSPPDFEKPNDDDKDNVYEVTVKASDGNLAATLDVEITVTNVNEAPSITGSATVSYTENGTASVATYSATDPEEDEITWSVGGTDAARFSISTTGVLSFRSSPDYEKPRDGNKNNVYEVTVKASDGNLTAELDVEVTVTNVSDTIVITGSATVSYAENGTANVAAYSATDPEGDGITWSVGGTDAARFSISTTGGLSFRSPPNYEKPRDGNKDNVYEVTVTASDGNLSSSKDVEVTVTNVNEAPSITGSAAVNYAENDTANVAAYSATDPEGDGITWSVGGTDAAQFSISEVGSLSFKSAPDFEKAKDDDENNVYEVTVKASDGNLESTLNVEITVTNANEAPSITGSATVSYAENKTENVAAYSATDPEGGGITWSVGGTDAARFEISAAGALSFRSSPDYEKPRDGNKNNVYEMTVKASDGNLSSSKDVEVTVTNVNEAPSITGSATVSYAENGTASVAAYSVTDPEEDSITWTVGGTDAARFEITAAGELSFKSPPDYEKPRDGNKNNVYEVTVKASDGKLSSTQNVEVTVTNVSEAPSISGSAAVSYAENGTASVAIYSATDPEGDSITWSVGGTDAARFEITAAGELSFKSPPDYEKPNDGNKNNVYEVTVTASDGNLESTLNVEVSVTDVTESIIITGLTTVSYAENGTASVAIYSATDPKGNGITWSVAGTDAAQFSISESGELLFNSPPNFESPVDADANNTYLVRIVVDDDGNESSLDVVVDVTDANDAPRFPSADIVAEIPENSCPGAHTLYRGIGETDEDGDLLTYALSGPDARFFVIHPPTGYVTLGPGNPLDFEASREPFALRVSVSDGKDDAGETEQEFLPDDEFTLRVTVTDVDEPPVFHGTTVVRDRCGRPQGHEPTQLQRTVISGARGGSAVGAALSTADPEGEPVNFRMVSQSDQGAFIIDSTSGQIKVAPDFSPRDARRVYRLRVAATDGGLESEIEVRIAVEKAPKPPPEPTVDDTPSDDDSEDDSDAEDDSDDESDAPPDDPEPEQEIVIEPEEIDVPVTTEERTPEGPASLPQRLQRRPEPEFVPVSGAVQVPRFAAAQISGETGRVHLTAPAATLAIPYQVRLTEDEVPCSQLFERPGLLECVYVSVEFFDVEGAPLGQASLSRPALLEVVLRTQDEAAGDSEIGKGSAEISGGSVELLVRQGDEQEWVGIRGDLREPADGSVILMVRVRWPGQYMALVTESSVDEVEEKDAEGSAPVSFMEVASASTQQQQNPATESAPRRAVSFVYDALPDSLQSQPAPFVSAEPQSWDVARLLIALVLDVTAALSAGIFLQRATFRQL